MDFSPFHQLKIIDVGFIYSLQSFKSPRRKSQPVSTLLEAGRSFSPAVMSQSEMDEVDSAVPVTVSLYSLKKIFYIARFQKKIT